MKSIIYYHARPKERMKNSQEHDLCIISQPKLYIALTTHLGKILFLCFFVMFIVSIIDSNDFDSIKRISNVIIIFTGIGCVVDQFLRKFAYKVIINFEKQTIQFYMCRTSEVKKYSFDSITAISNKVYIKFVFGNKKILYNGAKDNDLKKSLSKIKRHINNSTGTCSF